MHRRAFLGTLAAAAVPRPAAEAQHAPFVSSDVGTLKRVLVHTPGPEVRKGLGLGGGALRFLGGTIDERAAEDHLAMVQLLQNGGAQVAQLRGVLDEAVAEARREKRLESWLRGWAPQLAPRQSEITGAALLGAVNEFVYNVDSDGAFAPLTDPMGSIYWTRDSAVMTPRGVMICNFLNEGRAMESILMRFAYEFAPSMRKYPIVFDAAEEQITMEGGDTMVADERTIFMGVGNRTNEAAARRVARKLNMDVLAVQMPGGVTPKRPADQGGAQRSAIHNHFLHLDTTCCFVDKKAVVTIPYFYEMAWAGKDPLTRMLKGMGRLPRVAESDMDRMANQLKDLGKVRRYKAGSGELDSTFGDLKLVDYLKKENYRVIYVGGVPPEKSDVEQHMAEVVLAEFYRQAANVVAVAPGKVLAYAGNRHTQKALIDAGYEVQPFPGSEIMRNNGGPHCLTQPLERT